MSNLMLYTPPPPPPPPFSMNCTLNTLYIFCSLRETLPPRLEASNLEPSPDIDKLPDDITLAQTAATWKYIVQFQAQQRQQ